MILMNKKLFVAGIPFAITQEELTALFAQVGTVISATIIIDKFTGRSKGFGFVEMSTPEEATAAIAKFNEMDYQGRKLVVAEAKPMEKREFGGGDRGGFDNRRGRDNQRGGKRW